MAVAWDTNRVTPSAGFHSNVTSFSFSAHTPTGTPAGVIVAVNTRYLGTPADHVTGVTYGGVSLTRIDSASDTSGEPMREDLYFLGSGIPTGTQTCTVTNASADGNMAQSAILMVVTAGADTEVYTAGIVKFTSDGIWNEQNIDDGSTGVDSLRFSVISIGRGAVDSVGSNSSNGGQVDNGSWVHQAAYETTAGQGSRPVGGGASTSDDRAAIYFAVREASGGGSTFTPIVMQY